MGEELNLILILAAAFIAVASPGPGVFAIARASMNAGKRTGLALASGMTTGSFIWGTSAALGVGALLASHQAFFEIFRYIGSGYLLWLSFKSLKSSISPAKPTSVGGSAISLRSAYLTGLAIHLTNPKTVLFFASLYAIGVPADATASQLALVVIAVSSQTMLILHTYALILSRPRIMEAYAKAKKWFECVFAVVFGAAGLRLLFSRIG